MMTGLKKRHALSGLLLLAVIAALCWWNQVLSSERDSAARELAEARKRIGWLEARVDRLLRPTAAQLAKRGDAADAGGKPGPSQDPAAREDEEEEDRETWEVAASGGKEGSEAGMIQPDPIYGPFHPVPQLTGEGQITLAELRRLEKLPPLELRDYVLLARLLNSRGGELSAIKVRGGQRSKMEFIKEFPYPTSFASPVMDLERRPFGESDILPITTGSGRPFPVTPTVPTDFAFKNTGWTVELDMSAKGGLLLVKGRSEQVAFENFTAQPGETAKPIYDDQGTLQSDNKQLQPAFNTREQSFTFDMLPGKTYRLPLNSGDGGVVLELKPVPAE